MEIATLIFILSFLAIVATLVVSATRYMCEQKGKVSFKKRKEYFWVRSGNHSFIVFR